jgi:hypothetical protein
VSHQLRLLEFTAEHAGHAELLSVLISREDDLRLLEFTAEHAEARGALVFVLKFKGRKHSAHPALSAVNSSSPRVFV